MYLVCWNCGEWYSNFEDEVCPACGRYDEEKEDKEDDFLNYLLNNDLI